jgi:hypothetical protein
VVLAGLPPGLVKLKAHGEKSREGREQKLPEEKKGTRECGFVTLTFLTKNGAKSSPVGGRQQPSH